MHSNRVFHVGTLLGDGETTIALPHFSALMLAGVAPGLVQGIITPITLLGRAILVMPVSASFLIIP
ncbi:MAG: hypothetical protein ACJAXK_000114 [Yoonia sp.]|jgi:hypothetical protein